MADNKIGIKADPTFSFNPQAEISGLTDRLDQMLTSINARFEYIDKQLATKYDADLAEYHKAQQDKLDKLVVEQRKLAVNINFPYSATDFAASVSEILSSRGVSYDPQGKEDRSMQQIVEVFNAYTSLKLTTAQGWLFMDVLKTVRAFQNGFHYDSCQDKVVYGCLMAEEMSKNR